MNSIDRIKKTQELLFLHGYEYVEKNGNFDGLTVKAVNNYIKKSPIRIKPEINFDLYKSLYYSVHLDDEALHRRYKLILKDISDRKNVQQ